MTFPAEVRLLGKCKNCGAKITVIATASKALGDWQYYEFNGHGVGSLKPAHEQNSLLRTTVMCAACKRQKVTLQNIKGTKTKTKCGSLCWDAEGDSLFCKCQCAGLNHGAGYDFAGINTAIK